MNYLNKKLIWNRRKNRESEKKNEEFEDEMLGEEAREREKILWTQERLGVSREEALKIYKKSFL